MKLAKRNKFEVYKVNKLHRKQLSEAVLSMFVNTSTYTSFVSRYVGISLIRLIL